MLTSLAFVLLTGLAAADLCQRLKLPRIIGMLFTGILLGPYALDLLDNSILLASPDLRKIALVIILLKAGLALDLGDLKKVGRPALCMSFLPASFEILAYVALAPLLLGITHLEAAVLGAVMSAVSPAVVVPRMVDLMENRWGTQKGIPQLILAGASLDDVLVIVLFSTFVGMAQGGAPSPLDFLSVPVSILLGIAVGFGVGRLLGWFFESRYKHREPIRNSEKVIILLGLSFLLLAVEEWLSGIVPFSGLLAVMSMACGVRLNAAPHVTERMAQKFGKLWLAAEVILFVLVGAAVDIHYTLEVGLGAVAMLFAALAIRSLGVLLSLAFTPLTWRERLFCVIAYLPKATVQAAIGSVPLSLGLPCGKLVLSAAVLAILLTAPLGAFGIDLSYQKLLDHAPANPWQ